MPMSSRFPACRASAALAVVTSAFLCGNGNSFSLRPLLTTRILDIKLLERRLPQHTHLPPRIIKQEQLRWRSNSAEVRNGGIVDTGKLPMNSSSRREERPNVMRRKAKGRGKRGREAVISRWRMFNVELPVVEDMGKDSYDVTSELVSAIASKLGATTDDIVPSDVTIVRKSFDARTKRPNAVEGAGACFSYTVDVKLRINLAKQLQLKAQHGKLMPAPAEEASSIPRRSARSFDQESDHSIGLEKRRVMDMQLSASLPRDAGNSSAAFATAPADRGPRVVIVGAGPAGLFAALELVKAGLTPVILERGMPVERRGRSIGALFARRILDPESNLCYGEGGAGTWSDGKLTTRIGRNSRSVRKVLETLVEHGAPERILVDGKPHLGTDRLVRILQEMRAFLEESGATFRFGCKVEGLSTRGGSERGAIKGVKLAGGEDMIADRVILAVGHSSRAFYHQLADVGVGLKAKGIAVGFRIEHPQALINHLRYGKDMAAMVERGKGKVPVADYRLTHSLSGDEESDRSKLTLGKGERRHRDRSCYSFCMCPGGQVVPTSIDPREVCVNGMSFSKRNSRWANAALVVSLSPQEVADDIATLYGDMEGRSPVRGVYWQSTMERRAADMGGGDLVVPVQRVTDFMTETAGVADKLLPSSSYRLGVMGGPLHELYPSYVTQGLRQALEQFERRIPGFLCDEALLHGVETRTSSPVQVDRDPDTCESPTMEGFFPAGEGAGYAGGIVSAAVDGMRVGAAVASQVHPRGWGNHADRSQKSQR